MTDLEAVRHWAAGNSMSGGKRAEAVRRGSRYLLGVLDRALDMQKDHPANFDDVGSAIETILTPPVNLPERV